MKALLILLLTSPVFAETQFPGSVDEEPIKVQEALRTPEIKNSRKTIEKKVRKELFKAREEAKAAAQQESKEQ